jgi:hypothetical protein
VRTDVDKKLKAVTSFLQGVLARGDLETGQRKTILRAIQKLRKAARSNDPAKMRAAVANVASIFLAMYGE